jgi:hypothetical protein
MQAMLLVGKEASRCAILVRGSNMAKPPIKPPAPTPGKARDAGTGLYVPKEYAKTHPKTTVIEHDKPKKK